MQAGRQRGQARGGNERVLLADDEQLVLAVVTQHLQEAGYQVTAVRDGHDVLRIFERAPDDYDILVLDVMMPRMTGNEAAGRCRQIRPDLPVVFCSGYAGEYQNLAGNGETTLLVFKPFEIQQLLHAIRDLLDRRR